MFQVLDPDRRDLAAVRAQLRADPSLAEALLPPGDRWYQLGRKEQADDQRQLRLTADRVRWVSRRPANPAMLQHVIAASQVVIEAEEAARTLAERLGEPIEHIVWRLGSWSGNRPRVRLGERFCCPLPLPVGPWTRLGAWVQAVFDSPDPIDRAVAGVLRTGAGIDTLDNGVVTLFLPDGAPPPVFVRDDPASMRSLQRQLALAVRTGNIEGVRAVLLRGAQPDAGFPEPLALAFQAPVETRPALLQLLLEAGADPTRVKWAPLAYRAAVMDSLEVLVASGVPVDTRGPDGTTALHTAVLHRQDALVQALLVAGADPNLADVRGWTPLHLALAQQNEPARVLLVDAGARNLPDRAGIGAAGPGERPVPPPRVRGSLDPVFARAPWSLFADWLEQVGDPRGAWMQQALAGEQVPQLRAEGLRRIAALHPVLAEHCTSGMVQLEHGFAVEVRSRSLEQDAGVLQLLQDPEGARVVRAELVSARGLQTVMAPALASLVLTSPTPVRAELGLPGLQRIETRGCPSVQLAHATVRSLAVRLPMAREQPSCPLHTLDLPALHTLDLELAWVPDRASRARLRSVLEELPIRSLILQPVDLGLIEMLTASPLLMRLERLDLRSLRWEGAEAVLERAERFAHLELGLSVLEMPVQERAHLRQRLWDRGVRSTVRGESYRAEGGYANR